MASKRTAQAASAPDGLDKAGPGPAQAGERPAPPAAHAASTSTVHGGEDGLADDWSEGAVHRGRLRVRNLVTLRWLVTAGEAVLLLAVMLLRLDAPYPLCFA